MNSSARGLTTYLLVTFGLAWAIELGPVRLAGYGTGGIAVVLWLVAVMFTPTLGALAARRVEKRGCADAGLRWGLGRYHLAAWLLPFGLSLLAMGLTVLLGAGQFDPSGQAFVDKLPAAQRAAALAQMSRIGPWLPLLVIVGGLTQGVLITSIATFGEEFGWRGYLQPRLSHLGKVRAMVVVGLIWGIWHAPIILQGHNYPGHPYLGVALMVVLCVLLSLVFGWLFERSGSVLSPTLAHASLNSPSMGLGAFMGGVDPTVGGITGVIGLSVMAIFVLWLLLTRRLADTESPVSPEAPIDAPADES